MLSLVLSCVQGGQVGGEIPRVWVRVLPWTLTGHTTFDCQDEDVRRSPVRLRDQAARALRGWREGGGLRRPGMWRWLARVDDEQRGPETGSGPPSTCHSPETARGTQELGHRWELEPWGQPAESRQRHGREAAAAQRPLSPTPSPALREAGPRR